MKKIRWGVISTAKIGVEKVIPAMQLGKYSTVDAISSRDLSKAKKAARLLGIPKTYGSYEKLLADPEIDAIYNPLPNHLHVEWSLKALKAGKHVLCEKPIGMNYKEAVYLQKESKKFRGLKLMEAFMYRHHPQTLKIKELIDNGSIGDIRNIHTMFSYFNVDPKDVRNQGDIGGGGLLDIGCYTISFSRFIFGSEPVRVSAKIEFDKNFKTDILVSAVMEFKKGTSNFSCSTQMYNTQFAEILGTKGKIFVPVPFTPSPTEHAKIFLHQGNKTKENKFKVCDQYTIQCDLFSKSILNNIPVPTPFKDAVANMKVIDKIFESAKSNSWVKV